MILPGELKRQGAWSMEHGAGKDPPAGGDEVPRIGRVWSMGHGAWSMGQSAVGGRQGLKTGDWGLRAEG